MANAETSNPNDFKVVTFHNKTNFDFTPEMGCTYDGRPIFGISGSSGIKAGESIVLPYHIGNLLARNLAKCVMVRQAPADTPGIPTGQTLWTDTTLGELKASFLTHLYDDVKPVAMSETDRLMAKVEELRKFVETNVTKKDESEPSDAPAPTVVPSGQYADKAEVIAELTKRGIKFDARKSKSDLEKLLA